jgi:mannosylglycerate hydrolase
MKKYECHVISNTHWDREWVKSFQESRVTLVDMFEKLFELIDTDPNFRHFHLDSQTIPLEDYCELKPQNKPRLKKLISEGRLIVGPWYTLPEMNSIDGECIVRNLLIGHRIAKEYGRVMKVGYTPTSTGQVSQLPQIYNGFGIKTAIFYRGINQDVAPAEYIWRSPDGTESVGIRPPQHFSRCTFWGYVYLPIIHKYYDHIEDSKQNYWSNGGFLFRLAEEHENEFVELDPVKFFDKGYLEQALARLKSEITKHSYSNVLLGLHGHDASFPHEETPKLIAALNQVSDDIHFIHSDFNQYARKMEEIVLQHDNNVVLEGEMRHVNQSQPWNDAHLYPGVLSTKGRLKRRNREVENILIRHAEPASSLALLAGDNYETEILDYAWKLVLANHAHDTINACSLDAVYHDAMHRFKQAEELSNQVIKRSLARLVKKIDLSGFDDHAVLLTVFNLEPHERSGVSKIVLDMPHDMVEDGVEILDNNGRSLPVQIISAKSKTLGVDKIGFGKTHHSKRVEAWAQFPQVPASGYLTCQVKPKQTVPVSGQSIGRENTLENEFFFAVIAQDGSISVTDKQTSHTFNGLNTFLDEGELGNAWTPGRIPDAEVITTKGKQAQVEMMENGPVKATFRITHKLMLPVSSADNYTRRADERTEMVIISDVSLFKGERYLNVKTSLENTAKDHRLRVLFPSGLNTNNYYAAMPFDVVSRPIPKPSSPDWTEQVETSDPQIGFIGISDGEKGLAVTNIGLYEAEVLDDSEKTIAITLLRSFYQHGNWTKDRWKDEEFQNPGHHTFTYAICPHKGTCYQGDVHEMLKQLDNPLKVVQHGKGTGGSLPVSHSFFSVNKGLRISCIKKAEDGNGLIVRIYNPSSVDIEGELKCANLIKKATQVDLEEMEVQTLVMESNSVILQVPHHKIVTVKLNF